MNAKTLKKLRRASHLVRAQMIEQAKSNPTVNRLIAEGVIGMPPTLHQVYRRLKLNEGRR